MTTDLVKLTYAQEKMINGLKAAGLYEKLEALFVHIGDRPEAPIFNVVDGAMLQSTGGNAYLKIGVFGDGSSIAYDHKGIIARLLTLSSNPPDASEAPSHLDTE